MRSKTSCFNGTLFRKNLSRYWPLWGLASFGGAMFPLAMLLELLHNGFRFWSPLETRQAYYTVLSYGVPVISIVYAILCAMAVWSYLYNARSVGMMHTLPIRREGLFVTNVLSGLTMMAIPYAVTGVLLVLVTMLFGGFEPMGVLVTVLGVMGGEPVLLRPCYLLRIYRGQRVHAARPLRTAELYRRADGLHGEPAGAGLLLRPEQQLFRYRGVAQPRGIPRAEDLSQQHLRNPVGDGSAGRSAV